MKNTDDPTAGLRLLTPIHDPMLKSTRKEKLKAYLSTVDYGQRSLEALMYFGRDRDASRQLEMGDARGTVGHRSDSPKSAACGRCFSDAWSGCWKKGLTCIRCEGGQDRGSGTAHPVASGRRAPYYRPGLPAAEGEDGHCDRFA
jgi:hypothetical protein